MEREILFRGKRVDNGEWFYGVPVSNEFITFILNLTDELDELKGFQVKTETVGCYTGLTDRNGVRIFEGDILRFGSGDYVVEWCNEHSKFLQVNKQFSRELYICIKESEIIGNIHDDPELLGGDNNA